MVSSRMRMDAEKDVPEDNLQVLCQWLCKETSISEGDLYFYLYPNTGGRKGWGGTYNIIAKPGPWLIFKREHVAARCNKTSVRINCRNLDSVNIPCSCGECGLA